MQIIKKIIVLVAALAMPFANVYAQTSPVEDVVSIEGVIVSRDGENMLVRSATGNVTVMLASDTKVAVTKGLLGIRSDSMSMGALIPGLRVQIEAVPRGGQKIARGIKFSTEDLQRATDMEAALAVPQQQVKELQAEIVASKAADAALVKRFGDLADYDLKSETIILFEVNSSTLSAKAKQDLKALADNAKTIKGYLIQVAGYTDASGNASRNQILSDRRAESVVTYLRQSCDVGMSRVLAPVAMSESKAVATNETAQGRAENRRVTVKTIVNRGIAE